MGKVAKIISILIVFSIGSFLFLNIADARSGCCSWHGGVCGCGCCDGTPLSATCAPYYPGCGGGGYSSGNSYNYNYPSDENTQITPSQETNEATPIKSGNLLAKIGDSIKEFFAKIFKWSK